MRPARLWVLSLAVGIGGSPGCSKGEPAAEDPPSGAPPPSLSAAFEEAPALVSSRGASSMSPASVTPGSDAACGLRPGDTCTLREWMKANMAPAIVGGDFDALRAALDELETFAPTGYPNWVSIARDGSEAARVQDLGAVKASCRSCHAQYRDRYRRELRDRRL
jgi:hypothetical protein